ncbi:hypothetical protein D3C87_720100 [compost metagenome]
MIRNKRALERGRLVLWQANQYQIRAILTREIEQGKWEIFHYTNGMSTKQFEVVQVRDLVSTELLFRLS